MIFDMSEYKQYDIVFPYIIIRVCVEQSNYLKFFSEMVKRVNLNEATSHCIAMYRMPQKDQQDHLVISGLIFWQSSDNLSPKKVRTFKSSLLRYKEPQQSTRYDIDKVVKPFQTHQTLEP